MKTPCFYAPHLIGALCALVTLCPSAAFSQTLPDGWIAADVGNPAIAGSTVFDQGSDEFVITAAGRDIWGRSDAFHFLHQSAQGDFAVETGNIGGILPYSVNLHPWSKAGAMIRESLDEDSPYVYLCNTGNNGLRIQYRPSAGARSVDFEFQYGTPFGNNTLFLKIERQGDVFRFLTSGNQGGFLDDRGVDLIASVEVPMADTVFAGTAVTSHNASQAISARIQSFRTDITDLSAPPFAPTFAVNAGSTIGYEEFGPDQAFFGTSKTFSVNDSVPISDTTLDPIYRSERWGKSFSYEIPLEPGEYYVSVLMAEIFFNNPGARVFDVLIQGDLVADDLDLYAEVGKFAAYQVNAEGVVVGSNGVLDIDLDATVNNAKLSGLLVNKAPTFIAPGAPTPTYFDLEPKVLFPLERFSDQDGPQRLFIKEAITFPDRYGAVGTLEIVGDAVVYTPSPMTPFLAPSIFSESFEIIVSDGLSDASIFYYPYFCDDSTQCG